MCILTIYNKFITNHLFCVFTMNGVMDCQRKDGNLMDKLGKEDFSERKIVKLKPSLFFNCTFLPLGRV